MATKSKNHWLYVDYAGAQGMKELVLQLDKSEYKAILSATRDQTGKAAEILPDGTGEHN